MNKSGIEWCDSTWHPVTGCLNDCPYCAARPIANRFGGVGLPKEVTQLRILTRPRTDLRNGKAAAFPFHFSPTFYRYRLNEPTLIQKPIKIFVTFMGDLFGDWVPEQWIEEVFAACIKAPQHTYMFLTKNPARYLYMDIKGKLPILSNFWYGSTVTDSSMRSFYCANGKYNTFLSIEPIRESLRIENFNMILGIKWVIVGAQTGTRKDKIIPQREWIENIVEDCRSDDIPIFLKNNLKDIWGKPLIQEYPFK
jgi:protein gp37